MSNSASPPASHSDVESPRPKYDPIVEVRLATVLYGGVSLAIYMHGVTQELFRAVRATAPSKPGSDEPLLAVNQLTGSERVYRKLGQYLHFDSQPKKQVEIKDNDVIRRRIVVDIISGTSAGGINGIFLAKALAGQRPGPIPQAQQNKKTGEDKNDPLAALKQLWVNEGDMSSLLNDKEWSDGFPELSSEEKPQSLLNSRRMYLKLLAAFDEMDGGNQSTNQTDESPLVDELNLFITTTDINGLIVPIQLSDRKIFERQHRKVFEFIYATKYATGGNRNDFVRENNPFLAYVARCTSSFPVAFEPMTLDDVGVLSPFKNDPDKFAAAAEQWSRYFREYLGNEPENTVENFRKRAFGDGGYLDNKPFSYATDTLMRRREDVIVDRKLIYIEPSPEHPEEHSDKHSREKPDALENVQSALLTLPRYETIREDLDRLRERNRTIRRSERVLGLIEPDVKAYYKGIDQPRPSTETGLEWASKGLTDMIRLRGPAYGGYHRLKVAQLTDELAELIARLANENMDSDYVLAIRYLIGAWRDARYAEDVELESPDGQSPIRKTQNQFLLEFDFGFRFRRLDFLRKKIDELLPLDVEAEKALASVDKSFPGRIRDHEDANIRKELLKYKLQINNLVVFLRAKGRWLRSRQSRYSERQAQIDGAGRPNKRENPLWQPIEKIVSRLDQTDLNKLLKIEGDSDRREQAGKMVGKYLGEFDALAEELKTALGRIFKCCTARARRLLKPSRSQATLQAYLWHLYQHYEDYDMVRYPFILGTEGEETDPVEIIRISPEDANELVNEKDDGCRKLAGTSLGNFGAFLDSLWRESDIMWGRLDGAERIICALLPDDSLERKDLIHEAAVSLVSESTIQKPGDARRLLIEGFVRRRNPAGYTERECGLNARALLQFARKLREKINSDTTLLDPTERQRMIELLDEHALLDLHTAVWKQNSRPDREAMVRLIARGSQVFGRMLDELSEKYAAIPRKAPYTLIVLGKTLWGMIEVAVPRGLVPLFWRYWLQLLYLFEVFLIVGGLLFGIEPAQKLGSLALIVTLTADVLPRLLGGWIQHTKLTWRGKALGCTIGVVLLLLGIWKGVDLVSEGSEKLRTWIGFGSERTDQSR